MGDDYKARHARNALKRRRAIAKGILPCPWCGKAPRLVPEDTMQDGDAWAEVRCVNMRCAAQPAVRDGSNIAATDINYFAWAVRRWNKRVPAALAKESP
jgi:hypothetical protein